MASSHLRGSSEYALLMSGIGLTLLPHALSIDALDFMPLRETSRPTAATAICPSGAIIHSAKSLAPLICGALP